MNYEQWFVYSQTQVHVNLNVHVPNNLKSISLSLNVEKSCQKMHAINRLVNVMNHYNLIIDIFTLHELSNPLFLVIFHEILFFKMFAKKFGVPRSVLHRLTVDS